MEQCRKHNLNCAKNFTRDNFDVVILLCKLNSEDSNDKVTILEEGMLMLSKEIPKIMKIYPNYFLVIDQKFVN